MFWKNLLTLPDLPWLIARKLQKLFSDFMSAGQVFLGHQKSCVLTWVPSLTMKSSWNYEMS